MQASIERTDGRLVARFSRAYDDSFRGDATIAAIAAYHSSDAALAQTHEQRTKGLGLSLTGGAITVAEDNIPKLRQWHAGLMLLSWGVLLPLGAIMAATLKTFGPKSMWCAPARSCHLRPAGSACTMHARRQSSAGGSTCALPTARSMLLCGHPVRPVLASA